MSTSIRFCLAATILLSFGLAPAQAQQRQFPETYYDSLNHRSIHVFSDQLHSNLSENEARFAATHYVGCQKMPLRDIELIRKYNEDYLHLHYKLGITVDSIANYGMIINGQWFSDNRSPESNWGQVREHQDWFLTHSGEWTVHGERRMVMDISNEGFRDWWVTSCIEEMEGNACDGVFADTYTVAAIFGRTDNPAFSGSVDWAQDEWIPRLNDYGQYVYSRLDSAGYYFFPNIDNLQTTWANGLTHYSEGDYLHGAMMESWGSWGASTDAQSAIARTVALQKKGVFIHGEGYFGGSHDNPELSLAEERMWLAGTYLLVNHGRMYLSMYGPGDMELGMSRHAIWFPEYELDLGPWVDEWDALTSILWKSVFRRRYEKGMVLCNISASARTVELDSTYYLARDDGSTTEYWADPQTGTERVGLSYTQVTSLEMAPMSAAVLFYEEPGCALDPPGDYNGDGEFGMPDVLEMMRLIASGSEDKCLDYDGDTRINIIDAVRALIDLAGQ